jgi:hypothetical protein
MYVPKRIQILIAYEIGLHTSQVSPLILSLKPRGTDYKRNHMVRTYFHTKQIPLLFPPPVRTEARTIFPPSKNIFRHRRVPRTTSLAHEKYPTFLIRKRAIKKSLVPSPVNNTTSWPFFPRQNIRVRSPPKWLLKTRNPTPALFLPAAWPKTSSPP